MFAIDNTQTVQTFGGTTDNPFEIEPVAAVNEIPEVNIKAKPTYWWLLAIVSLTIFGIAAIIRK